jgi:hypothetical protein
MGVVPRLLGVFLILWLIIAYTPIFKDFWKSLKKGDLYFFFYQRKKMTDLYQK